MVAERGSFLEDLQFSKNASLSAEQIDKCKVITEQIAAFALSNPNASRHEQMPDGHLRTFTLGEETSYDTILKTRYTALTISILETRDARDPTGKRVEITGKVLINPNNTPYIAIEVKEPGFRRSWGHTLTPSELETVLNGLLNGSAKDPRKTDWREITEKSPVGKSAF